MTKSDFLQAQQQIFDKSDERYKQNDNNRKQDLKHLQNIIITCFIGLAGLIIACFALIKH